MLPGCGSSDKGKPIPSDQANQMIALIRLADSQSAAGTCSGAAAKVRQAQGVLDRVPKNVSRSVRQGIADGLDRLLALVGSECPGNKQQTQTQTSTTQTTTTPSTTTPTTTTPSTTTPTTTTPTTTTPTTTTPTTTTPTTTTPTTTTQTGTTTTGTGGTPPGADAGNQG